jgi:hypothetical protein
VVKPRSESRADPPQQPFIKLHPREEGMEFKSTFVDSYLDCHSQVRRKLLNKFFHSSHTCIIIKIETIPDLIVKSAADGVVLLKLVELH